MKKKNLPVNINEKYDIEIENLNSNGQGIGRINGYTLFIDGALPYERVKVKITKTNKNYGFAKLLEIIEKSPARVDPICEYFGECGGCQLQHYEIICTTPCTDDMGYTFPIPRAAHGFAIYSYYIATTLTIYCKILHPVSKTSFNLARLHCT